MLKQIHYLVYVSSFGAGTIRERERGHSSFPSKIFYSCKVALMFKGKSSGPKFILKNHRIFTILLSYVDQVFFMMF